jgi:hypothetical protein
VLDDVAGGLLKDAIDRDLQWHRHVTLADIRSAFSVPATDPADLPGAGGEAGHPAEAVAAPEPGPVEIELPQGSPDDPAVAVAPLDVEQPERMDRHQV